MKLFKPRAYKRQFTVVDGEACLNIVYLPSYHLPICKFKLITKVKCSFVDCETI